MFKYQFENEEEIQGCNMCPMARIAWCPIKEKPMEHSEFYKHKPSWCPLTKVEDKCSYCGKTAEEINNDYLNTESKDKE